MNYDFTKQEREEFQNRLETDNYSNLSFEEKARFFEYIQVKIMENIMKDSK